MPNRLANETSPYLRQHAHNPVDWYPWGPEALARARTEDRPILLSVGYAACHWCHVMERESFEDAATARLMNDGFVNVKVDREERPDVDAIYMQAVQAMTGHGGWPMTVFLTPDGTPFYGGTYFPPEDHPGMPSFRSVLSAVADAWRADRSAVTRAADSIRERLYPPPGERTPLQGTVSEGTLERATRRLVAEYDREHGGFGAAPKFPQAMALDFLLRRWRRTGEASLLAVVRHSYLAMARGGIHDQVGGGFARYAVDARWLVPHFEKMLYDNALLVRLGVHLWQSTGDAEVRRVVEEALAWVVREMTAPGGGFYSSLDADSEGEEGKFYVWTDDELRPALERAGLGPDETRLAAELWGVTPAGNFEGRTVLSLPEAPARFARRHGLAVEAVEGLRDRARAALLAARAARVRPGLDDKMLASWNGLMLRAMAEAARASGDARWHDHALRAARFLRDTLVRDARVSRVHTAGVTRIPGYLEDHAALALGFVAVYQLTFDREWLDLARRIGRRIEEAFGDDADARLFDTAADAESLITRPSDPTDNATPSGTSLAAELFLLLAEYFGETPLRARAATIAGGLAEAMARYPGAFGHLLGVADALVNGAVEVALVGAPGGAGFAELARTVAGVYLPTLVLAGTQAGDTRVDDLPLLAGRDAAGSAAAAYVCREFACELPATSPEALAEQLRRAPVAGRVS